MVVRAFCVMRGVAVLLNLKYDHITAQRMNRPRWNESSIALPKADIGKLTRNEGDTRLPDSS